MKLVKPGEASCTCLGDMLLETEVIRDSRLTDSKHPYMVTRACERSGRFCRVKSDFCDLRSTLCSAASLFSETCSALRSSRVLARSAPFSAPLTCSDGHWQSQYLSQAAWLEHGYPIMRCTVVIEARPQQLRLSRNPMPSSVISTDSSEACDVFINTYQKSLSFYVILKLYTIYLTLYIFSTNHPNAVN